MHLVVHVNGDNPPVLLARMSADKMLGGWDPYRELLSAFHGNDGLTDTVVPLPSISVHPSDGVNAFTGTRPPITPSLPSFTSGVRPTSLTLVAALPTGVDAVVLILFVTSRGPAESDAPIGIYYSVVRYSGTAVHVGAAQWIKKWYYADSTGVPSSTQLGPGGAIDWGHFDVRGDLVTDGRGTPPTPPDSAPDDTPPPPPSPTGGTILTDRQIAGAAAGAGFTGTDVAMAVAIALAESGGNTGATNFNTNGSTDYGLWQINTVHPDLLASGDWQNPDDNARMAHSVFATAGSSWTPWSTFNNNAYIPFQTRGDAAAADPDTSATGSGGTGTAPTSGTGFASVDDAIGPIAVLRYLPPATSGGQPAAAADIVSLAGGAPLLTAVVSGTFTRTQGHVDALHDPGAWAKTVADVVTVAGIHLLLTVQAGAGLMLVRTDGSTRRTFVLDADLWPNPAEALVYNDPITDWSGGVEFWLGTQRRSFLLTASLARYDMNPFAGYVYVQREWVHPAAATGSTQTRSTELIILAVPDLITGDPVIADRRTLASRPYPDAETN
jgi:hypothetical protein